MTLGVALVLSGCTNTRTMEMPDMEMPDMETPDMEMPDMEIPDNVDLRQAAVFSMSNHRDGNAIAAFSRDANGMLSLVDRFDTGGTGSGSFEDVANALVLGSDQGESSPNNHIETGNWLYAANAGSNSVTVFRVEADGLDRISVTASGGEKPVSVTVNGGMLYVLHSGETEDDLFDENMEFIAPNCTTGGMPSITGFRVSASGELTPIPNSTRQLSGDAFSGCAQVSFNPSGAVLVVTERTAVDPPSSNNMMPAGDEGLIVTFAMNADGTPGEKRMVSSTGQGPFGFTFTKSGNLLVTEQFDGPVGPRKGAASGYTVGANGALSASGGDVENGGTDTCWIVATDDGQIAFAASFFDPTPRISSYRVAGNGALSLIDAEAAVPSMQGVADIALSGDSRFLYNVNALNGMVTGYRVGGNGSLTMMQTIAAHAPSMARGVNQAGIFGLAAR
ncbi:lactonase family protein [Rubrivirga sp.]|uniref:lactonase family protein n=1 Tax=Rubrivirga sp. TaxID=1885344 RepID=UPI003B51E539